MKYVGERVPQPASGPVTYTDRETAQGAGGYEYQVVAIRPGGDGNRSNQLGWLLSDPSATTTSSVGAPPAASLGFGIVGGRLVPNSSAAGRGAAVSEYPPDTGYRRELPYKGVPPPTSVVIEEAAPAAPDADSPLPLGHRKQPLGSRALLLPVLGAAVLFSGALGLRYLSRRVG